MITTEADALTKWCAPGRLIPKQNSFDSVSGDYTSEIINPQDGAAIAGRIHCIASECMLWRWYDNQATPRGYCGFGPKPDVAV